MCLHTHRNLPLPSPFTFPGSYVLSHTRNLRTEAFMEHLQVPSLSWGPQENIP